MKKIPDNIYKQYVPFLKQKEILSNQIPSYLKWLRYYLDFCNKYSHDTSLSNSLSHFIQKLKQKNQSEKQIEQAKDAIDLFYKLGEFHNSNSSQSLAQNRFYNKKQRNYSTEVANVPKNKSWKNEFEMLKNEINLRHYSRKTLSAYTKWIRDFQAYLKSKSPKLLESTDVKKFLTHLAVEKQVAASTQNQAFNGILFFYRHVLKKEFGDLKEIPRAKRTKYVPAVLSRKEIDDIIDILEYPESLVAKLLYGSGLRLNEGLNLRVRDFDFSEEIVTI